MPVRILVAPEGIRDFLMDAVRDGGAEPVRLDRAAEAEAIVWGGAETPGGFGEVFEAAPQATWVQLPFAGIEQYRRWLDTERLWTCGKGVYADPVAEHALTLGLAGLRGVIGYARATTWGSQTGRDLYGGRVTIIGGGGIAESFIRLIRGFDARITVVRRSPQPLAGAHRTVTAADLEHAVGDADLVVVACALTPETKGLVDERVLRAMPPHAWLVNVARGGVVVTDDLVAALQHDEIGGAALDVTDPEPLPDGHPLWHLDNCVITPHTANTYEMAVPLLSARVTENVRRFLAGEPLIGPIDLEAGY